VIVLPNTQNQHPLHPKTLLQPPASLKVQHPHLVHPKISLRLPSRSQRLAPPAALVPLPTRHMAPHPLSAALRGRWVFRARLKKLEQVVSIPLCYEPFPSYRFVKTQVLKCHHQRSRLSDNYLRMNLRTTRLSVTPLSQRTRFRRLRLASGGGRERRSHQPPLAGLKEPCRGRLVTTE